MRILFASSEVFPLIKTGGLADVSYHLPKTLQAIKHAVRIIMPAYRDVLNTIEAPTVLATFSLDDNPVTLLQTHIPGTHLKVWLVEQADFFDRPGNPYLMDNGTPWPDEAFRFAFFSKVVSAIALGQTPIKWTPQIVHCNDWHTGLVPVYLKNHNNAPAVLFTIHNLAYQGLFDYATFCDLNLDPQLWHFKALEFHQQFSFIKGGLVFSDYVNTVSCNYAKEITTEPFGEGLHGLLEQRAEHFTGILNGIDWVEWNPKKDPYLVSNYNTQSLKKKSDNKIALQKTFKLPEKKDAVLIGWVARFTEQKGIDLVINTLDELVSRGIQVVLLGSGDKQFEQALAEHARLNPDNIALSVSYSETLAHQIIAGSDFLLLPSRFEPCGLTQMYALRYGTIPIGRKVGGLVDTIIDVNSVININGTGPNVPLESLNGANGILFDDLTKQSLLSAIDQALTISKHQALKKQLQLNGMRQDFSWLKSARKYCDIYQSILKENNQQTLPPA